MFTTWNSAENWTETCREKRSERQTSFGTNHVETEQATNPGNNSNGNKQTNAVEKIYKVLIGCANKSTKRASKQIEATQVRRVALARLWG